MTLKRLEKEAERRGVPKHRVRDWYNRLSDTEKRAINILSAGGIASLFFAIPGGGPKYILYPLVATGGYAGYMKIQEELTKRKIKKEKEERKRFIAEVEAEARKSLKKVV